ncbi:MAG: DUF4292 domain-containing protein [Cyclobacteriaceae bacterium]|jgi:hypothetical protein|nr:DUF4292 domain-containing protein [Cyclobacteriaceae bacterium]
MNKLVLTFLALLLLTSCNKQLALFNTKSSKLNINNLDFTDLILRSKIKYNSGIEDLKATANVRIKKDSLIWFSLTPGLGIEAARGWITKDSLILVDKIHKEYSVLTFKDLTEKFNFNMDYHMIESVILGNMIWPLAETDEIVKEEMYFNVSKKEGDLAITHFIGRGTLKLEKLLAVSDSTKNSMNIDYSDFDVISEKVVPAKASISIEYTSRKDGRRKISNIDFEHTKIDIDNKKLKYSFEIPEKYKYVRK